MTKPAPRINDQYEDLLKEILECGVSRPDRTGTGTKSLFSRQLRYDLQQGFPLITTKKVYTRAIIHELIWLISGDTNIKYLQDNDVHIWDEWCDENGNLGPVYGHQWRHWGAEHVPGTKLIVGGIDQLQNVIDGIKKDPYGRRHIVTAWNPTDLPKQALPPCHMMFQFYVANGKLSCQLYQRSADMFLGVPFNIASYAILTHMVAQQTGLGVGEFVWNGGDCHVYNDHESVVREQISRPVLPFPTLSLTKRDSINDYVFEDIDIWDIKCHGVLKAPVSV